MNIDQLEGKWKQVKGAFKEKWGKFTNDEIDRMAGKRDQIVGKLQERYGQTREQAEKSLDEWCKTVRDDEKARTSSKV
jgi:uncharacterized protein YjbJ (UPF0337 family)